jgi:hypothetical protein
LGSSPAFFTRWYLSLCSVVNLHSALCTLHSVPTSLAAAPAHLILPIRRLLACHPTHLLSTCQPANLPTCQPANLSPCHLPPPTPCIPTTLSQPVRHALCIIVASAATQSLSPPPTLCLRLRHIQDALASTLLHTLTPFCSALHTFPTMGFFEKLQARTSARCSPHSTLAANPRKRP